MDHGAAVEKGLTRFVTLTAAKICGIYMYRQRDDIESNRSADDRCQLASNQGTKSGSAPIRHIAGAYCVRVTNGSMEKAFHRQRETEQVGRIVRTFGGADEG